MKTYRISEILYWIIAVIATYEAIQKWKLDPDRAYLFVGFAVLSVGMALFRRHYRKKFSKRSKSSE